jgi:hypothetical protein
VALLVESHKLPGVPASSQGSMIHTYFRWITFDGYVYEITSL